MSTPTPPPPPAYPPPPPRPPAPPPANHKSGKAKTIGLIVGGVVLAGLAGGLVAVVAGGGDDGASSSQAPATNTGILDPKPVGSIDAPSSEPTPSEAPTEQPTEEPVPQSEEPQPAADGVTVGGVTVALPDGWSVMGDVGSDNAAFTDEDGSWVYVLTGTVDPTTDAGALLTGNLDYFVGGDNYSQVKVGDVAPLDPFGSMVSGATVDYRATWVDAQGSMPLRGAIWAAVRQDGTALIVSAEHAPPDDWDASAEAWGPVVDGTFNQFGGS